MKYRHYPLTALILKPPKLLANLKRSSFLQSLWQLPGSKKDSASFLFQDTEATKDFNSLQKSWAVGDEL